MSEEQRASENLARARALIERVGSEPPKALDGAIAATEDNRATITFSVFGVTDSHGDIVVPGAFTKSLAERGSSLPLIWNHDLNTPSIGMVHTIRQVGRDDLNPKVLSRFPEATGAMVADVEFFESQLAQNIYAGVKKGSPYQASYAYDAPKKRTHQFADGRKGRILEEIRVHELTVCHFGSNPATYLSKAAGMIAEAEIKAGWRHGVHADIETINQLVAMLIGMGATNAHLIDAAPQATPARTSPVDELIADIEAVL